MATVGGDIIEVTWNHPTLGSGILLPKAAEDSTYDLGGFTTGDDANMITGSGDAIYQMNNTRWSFEVTCAWDMNTRGDLEKMQALGANSGESTFTITNINGTVYSGTGKPVGPVTGNGNNGTFKLKVSGGGGMKKISG